MNKIISTIILSLSFITNAIADDHLILIQCKDDRPELAFLQPIYEINLETKKVKAGAVKYRVIQSNEEIITIHNFNGVMENYITFNRNSGRYQERKKMAQEGEIIEIIETGICVKKEKAF
jgi:hypothetical protein